MRRHLLTSAALLLSGCFLSFSTFAQSGKQNQERRVEKDETVIIKNPDAGRTVIEIKDGNVYVNGRSIMSVRDEDATRVHKKIIIENGGDASGPQDWGDVDPGFSRMPDAPDRPKALLGVRAGLSGDQAGAAVRSVAPGSPAEAAGLKEGDVITSVDGKRIAGPEDLVQAIRDGHQPGDQVIIRYQRTGKEFTANIRLAEAKNDMPLRNFSFPRGGDYRFPPDEFGRVRTLPGMPSDALRPRLGATVESRASDGVSVLSVEPGSVAASAGLRTGDVITGFGDTDIKAIDDLQRALDNTSINKDVQLQFQRDGRSMTVTVRFKSIRRRAAL